SGLFNVYTAQWGWSSLSNTDVVYLDAIDGLENNNGLTPATAVNTLEKAISLLNGRGKITAGYVYLVKDYSHTVTGSSGGEFSSFP
ncbi:MAG TPA: hypothetical protein DCY74_04640, partial [Clostridiales bacterium]|nr:hypothetical protein [Clostridiales bacterium]